MANPSASFARVGLAGDYLHYNDVSPEGMMADFASLQMQCVDIYDSPVAGLPAGYSLRYYLPGDEANWQAIHDVADAYNRDRPDLFRKQFGTNQHLLSWRQIYMLDSAGKAVATVTAWFDERRIHGPYWGQLHWLAIVPEQQGKGLGDTMVTACLQTLRGLGHREAFLFTDSRRLPAVNLYLKYGFRPVINSREDEVVWRELAPR
ncbi:MAG: GNAT family N-acetyltransferase, partial [Anaerolineales bacterium]|nr:GNAT family N-acetyltransferase [Anaerolineales bacterium]